MERVELAHESDFLLGRLTVAPSRREIIRNDGVREVIEHRMMQVLIALVKANGAIVTRDELTQSCWDGRIVGEDALNRVISRLRRVAQEVGAGSFRIETITRIGYRLMVEASEGHTASRPAGASSRPQTPWATRRTAVASLLATSAAGAAGFLLMREKRSSVPLESAWLMDQGWRSITQDTHDGQRQAVRFFRRVTEISPDYADGWAMLGMAYSQGNVFGAKEEGPTFVDRARAAARRSLELDPGNPLGDLILTFVQPGVSRFQLERALRRAFDKRRGNDVVTSILAVFLSSVGRFGEAVTLFEQIRTAPRTVGQYYNHIQSLWGAGRFEELDRLVDSAAELYSAQAKIWFSRFTIALYGGRPGAAIALAEDIENWPTGIPAEEFEDIIAVARAVRSRDTDEIETVISAQMRRAQQGRGMARNAIQFACALGRVGEAFAIAEALFFGRGFTVPDARQTAQNSLSTVEFEYVRERFLFQPSTALMRADPRFNKLTQELGLERYWREAGVQPDYRRS